MPQPGDQYRDTPASINPFAPPQPRISEWTAQEIATLQSRLDRQLGPEYISTRPGAGGGKVHYLAAEKVINLANSVFGFNGWSSSIQSVQIDFCDENVQSGKISLGLSTIVRVTLRDGTYHEDTGYGHIENCKGKAAAFEKCKKEAATDALKRALRNFGNMLGNCLYDKDYLQKVTKLKVAPTRWGEENLHRHPDFVPNKVIKTTAQSDAPTAIKRNISVQSRVSDGSAMFEDDFESNFFDDADFTNDASMLDSPIVQKPQAPAISRTTSMPAIRPTEPVKPAQPAVPADIWAPPPPREPPPDVPLGFVTGRVADLLEKPAEARPPAAQMAFDPHHESPGIRRTQAVHQGKSAPIKLSTLGRQPQPIIMPGAPATPHTDYVNPSADPNRQIGKPPGNAQGNRGAYKPPTSVKRPALADVSNLQSVEAPDSKKQKIEQVQPSVASPAAPPAQA